MSRSKASVVCLFVKVDVGTHLTACIPRGVARQLHYHAGDELTVEDADPDGTGASAHPACVEVTDLPEYVVVLSRDLARRVGQSIVHLWCGHAYPQARCPA